MAVPTLWEWGVDINKERFYAYPDVALEFLLSVAGHKLSDNNKNYDIKKELNAFSIYKL